MVFKSPENISKRDFSKLSIFLAGSIEMGLAEDWQAKLTEKLQNKYNIFNPRRDDWNSSWKQEFEDPQFSQQVNWELNALDKADYIIMYFDPNTKSPISLLELGLYAKSNKLYVVCPNGFWRKGNVDIVCDRLGIPIHNTVEEVITILNNIKWT